MFNLPINALDLPQPQFHWFRDGAELTEDSITIGQIIAVWIVTITAIALFFLLSTLSVETITQPVEPDRMVRSGWCNATWDSNPVALIGDEAMQPADPLPEMEHCHVRFF